MHRESDPAAVRTALEELVSRVGAHPGVRLIDIGLDDDNETPILRVHVDPTAQPLDLPERISGYRVQSMLATYRPEKHQSGPSG